MNRRAVQDLYDDMLRKMRSELPPEDWSYGGSAKVKAEREARNEAASRLAKERRASVDRDEGLIAVGLVSAFDPLRTSQRAIRLSVNSGLGSVRHDKARLSLKAAGSLPEILLAARVDREGAAALGSGGRGIAGGGVNAGCDVVQLGGPPGGGEHGLD